jgi:hypothetical protein
LLLLAALPVLGACTTDAIVVSEVALTDRPDARVLGWSADEEPRQVFSPEDEEVTIKVLFEFNYRAVYEWYTVEWIAPDGSPYQVLSLRTEFGSHRDLKASLPIRGKMASRMPGIWRVRIWLRGREGAPDRLLAARIFRIAPPSKAQLARGLTPVDRPGAGDAPAPAGAAAAQAAGSIVIDGQHGRGAPGVLPPLAVEPTAAAPAPRPERAPPPADVGVAAVTVESTPDDATRPRHGYVGCPPLYYPPGPDCVERALEE